MKPWDGFQEGNAFQYTWYVPQDPAGLIEKLGVDLFNERLENTEPVFRSEGIRLNETQFHPLARFRFRLTIGVKTLTEYIFFVIPSSAVTV